MAEMNKALAVKMGNELMEAARKIGEKYGYDVKRGSGKYDSSMYKMSNVEFFKRGELGKKYSESDEDAMKREFDFNKPLHGLSKVNVGDLYRNRDGVQMKVVGWKARNRKYPVLVQNMNNGSLYKITPTSLKVAIYNV